MNAVTVILEFNCNPKGGVLASVWMLSGRVAHQIGEMDCDIAACPGAEKILGPVEIEVAQRAYKSIQNALQHAGVPFEARDVADD